MAAPPIAQISQAAGGPSGAGQTPGRLASGITPRTTKHKRRFFHYFDNSMNATGLVGKIVDEGWQMVPYRCLRASVTPREWAAHTKTSGAFRIKSIGFNARHLNPMVERIVPRAGATALDSVFDNHPFAMWLTDEDMTLDPCIQPLGAVGNWNAVNSNLTRSYPGDMANGTLRRVQFDLGEEFVDSLNGETTDAWGSFTTLDDFDITTAPIGGSAGITHTMDNRWYPTAPYKGHRENGANIITTLNEVHDLGVVENVIDSQVNRMRAGKPPAVMVKMNPIYGIDGAINVGAQMLFEYFCEIDWMPCPSGLLTLNMGPTPAGTNAWARAVPPQYSLVNPYGIMAWQERFNYETVPPNAAKVCSYILDVCSTPSALCPCRRFLGSACRELAFKWICFWK